MANKWQEHCLGELGSFKNGANFNKNSYGHKYPIVSVKNLFRGRFVTTDGLDALKEGAISKVDEYYIEKGDLVFARSSVKRDGAGQVAIVRDIPDNCIFSGFTIRFRLFDKSRVNPMFLLYLFKSPEYRELFTRIATGTTISNLSQKILSDIKVNLPSKSAQDLIVKQIDDLDTKTELNYQINQTLELMAQVLFKSWFVDFDPVIDKALNDGVEVSDFPAQLQAKAKLRINFRNSEDYRPLPNEILNLFPSEFVNSRIGWVPKGWQVSNIDETCSHIIDHRGKTPKKLGGDWAEEGFSAISAKNVKGNQIVRPETIRYVDEALYRKWMKVPLQPKDIIMTSEAPMGEMFFLADKADYLLSQRLYGMRADEEKTTGEYLNYWLQTVIARADLEGRATGTTVTGIRQVELKKVTVLLPDLAISNKFSELAGQYLLQKELNNNQRTSLEETRDYLLPNLITGKVQLGKVS